MKKSPPPPAPAGTWGAVVDRLRKQLVIDSQIRRKIGGVMSTTADAVGWFEKNDVAPTMPPATPIDIEALLAKMGPELKAAIKGPRSGAALNSARRLLEQLSKPEPDEAAFEAAQVKFAADKKARVKAIYDAKRDAKRAARAPAIDAHDPIAPATPGEPEAMRTRDE